MKQKSNYVQCFYCEDMLNRPQGRAAHIRKAHPGAPYQPTPEQITEYKATYSVGAEAPPNQPVELMRRGDIGSPSALQAAIQPAHLTPREHLVAAISEVKEELESTRRQIPVLETQLQHFNASQEQLVQNMQTLETALSAIVDETGRQPLPLESEAPAPPSAVDEPKSPAPASSPAVKRSVRRHPVSRRASAVGASHA